MLKSLHIEGFQSHKDTLVEFVPGVNIVVGPNNSGKSSMLRSLYWLFKNRPSGELYIRHGSPLCKVSVTTDRGTASRSRIPENYYEINGKQFRAVGTSVPPTLKEVLNLESINFQSQLVDQLFLIHESPGNIARYVSDLLGYKIVDSAIVSTKSRSSGYQDAHEKLDRERKALELQVTESEYLLPLQSEFSSLKTMVDRLENLEREVQSLTTLIKDYSEVVNRGVKLKELLQKTEVQYTEDSVATYNSLFDLIAQLKATAAEIAKLNVEKMKQDVLLYAELDAYKTFLQESETCPVCFSTISPSNIDLILHEICPAR